MFIVADLVFRQQAASRKEMTDVSGIKVESVNMMSEDVNYARNRFASFRGSQNYRGNTVNRGNHGRGNFRENNGRGNFRGNHGRGNFRGNFNRGCGFGGSYHLVVTVKASIIQTLLILMD